MVLLETLSKLCVSGQPANVPQMMVFMCMQDVITRVQELDRSGRISGVMDDRGKVCSALVYSGTRLDMLDNLTCRTAGLMPLHYAAHALQDCKASTHTVRCFGAVHLYLTRGDDSCC